MSLCRIGGVLMSQIILTEIDLDESAFGNEDVKIEKINGKTICQYNGNPDVIIIVGCRATANIVLNLNFPGLVLYQLTSAGVDGIPLSKFANNGIWVCNAGDVYSIPIAETVIYGILLYEKRYWNNPNWHMFRPTRGYKYINELAGKKMLIMGCGRIGNAVAVRAAAFDIEVYGYNHNCRQKKGYIKVYATWEELLPHLDKFDYIVTTIPLNEETKGFLDAKFFEAMSEKAIIINVARNGIFNKQDLYKALKTKKIYGAVLDIFETIPNPITNPFRRLSNTIVLPGVSAISQEVKGRLKRHVTENILNICKGKKPNYIVSQD